MMRIITFTPAQGWLALCGSRDADGALHLWTLPVVGWGLIERHDETDDSTARSVVGMVAPPMESYELHVANRVRGFLDTYLREGEDVEIYRERAEQYLHSEEEAARRWREHHRQHEEG
jgi:hypothetical protein